ncbi:MAG: ABC transporter substrate-binding protein [Bacilli bacterium]
MKRKVRMAGAVAAALTMTAGLSAVSPAQAASSQVVNLITWVNPPAVAVLKKINAEFEKAYPGYTVNYQTTADVTGGYATAQQTAVQGGTADIMGTFPFQPMPFTMNQNSLSPTQLWAVNKVFAPLNGQPWVKNFNSSILSNDVYKGKLYGLVTGVYQDGVFYNKTIFAKYHLSPPKTYNQFIHIAQVLSAHHVVPFFDGLQNVGPLYLQFITYPLMQELWLPKVGNVNTALWTNKTKWTDPAFIKVMARERAIMKYLEPNFTGVPWQAMPGAFANGKSAMLLDGSWDLASVVQANPHINMGYFPLPGSNNPKVNQSLLQPDLTFVVLNNSPHKAAALKWLNFFASPKIYAQYVDATGISPSRNNGRYSGVASHTLGSWFGKGVSLAKIFPQLPGSGSYYVQPKNWWELQLEMYQGKYTPQKVASLYQSAWNQVKK